MLVPNCECKLLDDDGKEVGDGELGELYVRGPNVCLGYWKNDKATTEALDAEKWLKTGDVAIVRNNWFWIVDRKKVWYWRTPWHKKKPIEPCAKLCTRNS
jgi:4-coumarate--CoA ligase